MPRVTKVAKAQKPQGQCSRCGVAINAGDPYLWWKFKRGGRRVRCARPECRPRPSDLTQSEIRGGCYAVQESYTPADAETFDDLEAMRDEIASAIQEVCDLVQEKIDNIEEGFGHPVPVSEDLADRLSEIESWRDEVEGVDTDDPCTDDEEPVEPDREDFATDEAFEEAMEEYGSDVEAYEHAQTERAEAFDSARGALQDALDACPE